MFTGCVTISNVPAELEAQTNASAQFSDQVSKGVAAFVDAAVEATEGEDKETLKKAGEELKKRADLAAKMTAQTAEAVRNLRKKSDAKD